MSIPVKNPHRLFSATLALFASSWLLRASDFDVRDETEFKKIVSSDAKLEKLATGMRFTEGPVWLARDGGYLVFSDIPANELKKWTAQGGLTTFRTPSFNANGNTIDREGRLISCEHSGRRLSILGTIRETLREPRKGEGIHRYYDQLETLVDRCDGKKFNSPNDAVVKSDGMVWFTDPTYGLPRGEAKEQEGNFVFRFDPKTKTTTIVARDFDMPNGLCFSPDEKKLYVADSGKPRHIRVFDATKEGTLTGAGVYCQIDKGGPDGIRCDADGRVWSSAGDGVHIFAPDGKLIGKILVPEGPANLCFGGNDGKTLFITARTSLYSISVLVKGAQ